jgi:hypothetical protein
MSRSGIFNLVSRDDRFEALTQTNHLLKRLGALQQQQRGAVPTIADVSRTHVLYVREAYQPHVAITSEYVKVQANGGMGKTTIDSSRRGKVLEFPVPTNCHFISDMVFNAKLPEVGNSSGSTYYRWASLPGARLLQRVAFLSGRTEVDHYDADDVMFRGKFRVAPDRRPAWERMLGQEETRVATYFNRNGWTGEVPYRDGLQTPKKLQPETDLWIPAQFWMCDRVASALPSSLIPASQRMVRVDLEGITRMLYAEDGCGSSTTLDISEAQVEVTMYVNCLFTLPEVAEIFHKRMEVTLIRVHRSQKLRITNNTGALLLNSLKWPVEYMMVGARDMENVSAPDRWNLLGRQRTRARAERITVPVLYYNGTNDELVARDASEVSALDPILLTLSVTAEGGIDMYPKVMPATFYNAYLPGRYKNETCVASTTDPGAYLVNFCLWPGRREQTGTLDTTAIRDLRLEYTSSGVSSDAPSEVLISAMAINFLVRNKDDVGLMYAV